MVSQINFILMITHTRAHTHTSCFFLFLLKASSLNPSTIHPISFIQLHCDISLSIYMVTSPLYSFTLFQFFLIHHQWHFLHLFTKFTSHSKCFAIINQLYWCYWKMFVNYSLMTCKTKVTEKWNKWSEQKKMQNWNF